MYYGVTVTTARSEDSLRSIRVATVKCALCSSPEGLVEINHVSLCPDCIDIAAPEIDCWGGCGNKVRGRRVCSKCVYEAVALRQSRKNMGQCQDCGKELGLRGQEVRCTACRHKAHYGARGTK